MENRLVLLGIQELDFDRFPYREAADGPTTCPKGFPCQVVVSAHVFH
jgi:hypothetical protein